MINIEKHKLNNGLTILLCRNSCSNMAVVNTLYKVGSRNENFEHTGLAHLLEHLMFSGSKNAPKFDTIVEEASGINNAWTSEDITNYYEILPSNNIETALFLEADRMRGLSLSEKSVEIQRSVVCEEFKQRYLNAPYGDLWHVFKQLSYKLHPYRWPAIGKALEDIENVDSDIIKDFYNTYYHPNNAIISVVGNVDADNLFKLAEKWFGDLPESKICYKDIPAEPQRLEPRFSLVERNVPNNILMKGYAMCNHLSKDYAVCDLISDILSNGRSSRLFRSIFAKGNLVSSIDASISGTFDAGQLIIKAQLLPGVSYADVENAIDQELDKLINTEIGEVELEKNKNRFESNWLLSNISNEECAANLAYFEMLGDAHWINNEVNQYRDISTSRVQEVAAQLFSPNNCVTLHYQALSTYADCN